MDRLYDLIIHGGLLVLLIFTPLAFGAVYPWGIALVELVAFLMALAWAFKLLHGGKLRVVSTPLNLPIVILLGLVGLQLLPLPPAVLGFVSPNTYAFYQRTLEGPYQELLALLAAPPATSQLSPGHGEAPWYPLSLYPHATRTALFEAISYAAVFLIVVNTVRTGGELRGWLLVLIGMGTLVAVVGLVQKVSGATKIYGVWQGEFGGSFFGPYVSRNHFAGYVAMIFPLALGWLWGQLVRRYKSLADGGWKQHVRALAVGKAGRRLLQGLG